MIVKCCLPFFYVDFFFSLDSFYKDEILLLLLPQPPTITNVGGVSALAMRKCKSNNIEAINS